MNLKSIYKNIVPEFIRNSLSHLFYKLHLRLSPLKGVILLQKLRQKEFVNVILFMYNADAWKLHTLYQELNENKRFKPIVIICPIISKGEVFLHEKMDMSIAFCNDHGYNYDVAYDLDTSTVIDIRKKMSCDIVFFTNPNQLSGESLYIDNFDDCLTCYVPYSFRIDRMFDYEYNNRTANKVWKCFYETALHKQLAETYADNKGNNVVVSGFPHMDIYNQNQTESFANDKKIIIWAPHWTIKGAQTTGLDWACFLDYCELFLVFAEKYMDNVNFVMKPHPFLFETLKQDSVWGAAKLNTYIKRWENARNCSIEEGGYVELFHRSHALIHDSGSFMTEYLLQNKPMAYTVSHDNLGERFNIWGDEVLKAHRLIDNELQLENFILDVVSSNDTFKRIREELINENKLSEKQLVSTRIVEYLNDVII